MTISITIIIIIVTVLVSLGGFNNPRVMNDLILYPPAIKERNQWYRLLTSGFLHADYQHLIFNMITLYFFGTSTEALYTNYLGKFGFIFFYLSAIIVSDLPSYFKHRDNYHYRSLGASGGVSAVVFGFILIDPWSWFTFPPVPAIVYGILYLFYSVYMSKKGTDNINHDAHFWGALFGIGFTIVMDPHLFSFFLQQIGHPRGPGRIG